MAGSINKVILIGNLGKDPEIRMTQNSGAEVATLSVATSDIWKDKVTGERREKTEWHKVVVFVPQLVQIIKNYAKKGSKIYVEGALQTRKWLSQDNVERYVTEIAVQAYNSNITLLDSSGDKSNSNGNINQYNDSPGKSSIKNNSESMTYNVEDLNDEIPF
jgi:single-strand DNA-binding protein